MMKHSGAFFLQRLKKPCRRHLVHEMNLEHEPGRGDVPIEWVSKRATSSIEDSSGEPRTSFQSSALLGIHEQAILSEVDPEKGAGEQKDKERET